MVNSKKLRKSNHKIYKFGIIHKLGTLKAPKDLTKI
jgi:hypothetical protein